MIAELAAFNAAFGVVKEFVANGKDLSECFRLYRSDDYSKRRPKVKTRQKRLY
jgi:hypothetical protein